MRHEDNVLPVIYFGDAEGQVEAATIGRASPSYSDSWDPFTGKRIWDDACGGEIMNHGKCANGEMNEHTEEDYVNRDGEQRRTEERMPMFKEGDLPPGARVYGGSRFDWRFYREKRRNAMVWEKEKEKKRNNNEEEEDAVYDDDWDGFGGDRGGYWILPAVELRREVVETMVAFNGDVNGNGDAHVQMDDTERNAGKYTEEHDNVVSMSNGGERKVTLAVHLHNLSSFSLPDRHQSRQRHHRQGWHNAALRILIILRELTDQLSPAVPCTTLPPVLTRSESTVRGRGKSRNGNSGDGDDDSGYAFERGVTEALRQIQSKRKDVTTTEADNEWNDISDDIVSGQKLPMAPMPQKFPNGLGNEKSLNKNQILRKVVLARKVDLNLGSSVSGLDVLMRVKFGGHIGHIFYLNPGETEEGRFPFYSDQDGNGYFIRNREFLGCTPERLFRVKGSWQERMVSASS